MPTSSPSRQRPRGRSTPRNLSSNRPSSTSYCGARLCAAAKPRKVYHSKYMSLQRLLCYRYCTARLIDERWHTRGGTFDLSNIVWYNILMMPIVVLCRVCVPSQALPPPVKVRSRELIASHMYHGCVCGKRNGLQDQCRRWDCRGFPFCCSNGLCKPSGGPGCDGTQCRKAW